MGDEKFAKSQSTSMGANQGATDNATTVHDGSAASRCRVRKQNISLNYLHIAYLNVLF